MSKQFDHHLIGWREYQQRMNMKYGILRYEQYRWEVRRELHKNSEYCRRARELMAELEAKAATRKRW